MSFDPRSPAPVHLNPNVERLWSEYCQAVGEERQSVAEQLLAEVLDHSIPTWERASFEIRDGRKTSKRVRLWRVTDLTGQVLSWWEHIDGQERSMISTVASALVPEVGDDQALFNVLVLQRGMEPGTASRELMEISAGTR